MTFKELVIFVFLVLFFIFLTKSLWKGINSFWQIFHFGWVIAFATTYSINFWWFEVRLFITISNCVGKCINVIFSQITSFVNLAFWAVLTNATFFTDWIFFFFLFWTLLLCNFLLVHIILLLILLLFIQLYNYISFLNRCVWSRTQHDFSSFNV